MKLQIITSFFVFIVFRTHRLPPGLILEPDLLLPPALPPLSPSRPLPPPPAPTPKLPPAIRPRVDTYLKLATAGEPVHFRCWMAGKSSDELQWRRLGDQQEPREGVGTAGDGISLLAKTEPDGHSAFLIFGAVKETDAGEYECVDRGTGIASSLVRLRIEPARSPVIDPMEQSVPEGSTAQLHCSVPGHPDAQLMWRRENGVEVGTVEGASDDGRGTLRIGGARKEHERMGWVCWAIYSQRADKQALSAGPALIRVVPSEAEPETEPISVTTPEGEEGGEGIEQKGGEEQPELEKGVEEEETDQTENDEKGGEIKPEPEQKGEEEADRTEENDHEKPEPEPEPTETELEEGGKETDQTEASDRKGGEEQPEPTKPTETENTTGTESTESVGADLNPTEPTPSESAGDQSTTETGPIDRKSTSDDEAEKNNEGDKEGNALAEISENLFTP